MVPPSCGLGHALLFGGDDVERHHRQDRAVHGHRHRHLVEGDAVEELAHVEDGVDGHPGHADVARHPGVVRVVAPVGGEVERHRQALLPCGEVATVEGVRFGGRGEPRVLTDGPGLVRVHRGVGATNERREARERVAEVQGCGVGRGVQRGHVDGLGGLPHQRVGGFAGGGLDRRGPVLGGAPGLGGVISQIEGGEVGDHGAPAGVEAVGAEG